MRHKPELSLTQPYENRSPTVQFSTEKHQHQENRRVLVYLNPNLQHHRTSITHRPRLNDTNLQAMLRRARDTFNKRDRRSVPRNPIFLGRASISRMFLIIALAILGVTPAIPLESSILSSGSHLGLARLRSAPVNQPPLLIITNLSPNPGIPGRTIRLNFTAQDPDGNVTATWIDWGDGSNPDLIFNMTSLSMCQTPGTDTCAISPGDLLFSKAEDPSSIVIGSIVIFRPYPLYPSYMLAHRVVWIFPPNSTSSQYIFWTKGDANLVMDFWNGTANVPANQVVAVYQYTILSAGVSPIQRTDTHAYRILSGYSSKAYTVTVNATDDSGSTAQLTVTETIGDSPPSVGITSVSPNPLVAGSRLTLNFIATDSDGTVSTITIDWGDGTAVQSFTGGTNSETHIYSSAGTYTTTVRVTDNAGLTSPITTTTITVNAQPSGVAPATVLGLEPLIFYGIIASIVIVLGAVAVLGLRARRRSSVVT